MAYELGLLLLGVIPNVYMCVGRRDERAGLPSGSLDRPGCLPADPQSPQQRTHALVARARRRLSAASRPRADSCLSLHLFSSLPVLGPNNVSVSDWLLCLIGI